MLSEPRPVPSSGRLLKRSRFAPAVLASNSHRSLLLQTKAGQPTDTARSRPVLEARDRPRTLLLFSILRQVELTAVTFVEHRTLIAV